VNAVDRAAVAAYPEIGLLLVIRDAGWRFLPPAPGQDWLDGFRAWPGGWRDGMCVRSVGDALAIRTNPDGDLVWEHTGTLVDVVTELLVLPVPGDPSGPRLVIGSSPER